MLAFKSLRSGRRLAVPLLLALLIALPALATAGTVTFTAPTITLTESPTVQTGFLDVTISDSGTDVINGFELQLKTPGPITFTGADTNTTPTYVFAGNSSIVGNPNAPFSVSGNLDYYNTDVALNAGQTLTAGVPLGLLRVAYSIPANFVGTVALTIPSPEQDPIFGDGYLDSGFNTIEPTIVNGSITVLAPTPEPSSIVLLVLGALGLFGAGQLRNRRSG